MGREVSGQERDREIEDMITSCNVWATVGLCLTKHNRKPEYSECGTQIIAINRYF